MPPRRHGRNRSQSLLFRPRVEGSGGWRVTAQIFEGLPFCHTQRKGAANRRYTLPRKARRERKLQERNVFQSPSASQTEPHTFNDLPGNQANTDLYFSRQAGHMQGVGRRTCVVGGREPVVLTTHPPVGDRAPLTAHRVSATPGAHVS